MCLKDPFLLSITMADANLQKRDLLHLCGLPFLGDLKWNDSMESISRSAVWNVDLLCGVGKLFSPESQIFISLPFINALYIAATCGLVLVMYIWRFLIKPKESAVLSVLTWHLGFSHFPTDVMQLCWAFSIFSWQLDFMNVSIVVDWQEALNSQLNGP